MVPARAGVIPARPTWEAMTISGSRASGGDPEVGEIVRNYLMWFPRERG